MPTIRTDHSNLSTKPKDIRKYIQINLLYEYSKQLYLETT